MITIRKLPGADISRIGEIDRSEEIRQDYACEDGRLVLKDVDWCVPRWSEEGTGDHSVAAKTTAWKQWLDDGGTLFGAFENDMLAGFPIYRPSIAPATAQFAVIHVSRSFRRRGVGKALADAVIETARADGARFLYVSSAPTKGTVEFYQSLGCKLAERPNEELYALEPDDIHMVLDLDESPNHSLNADAVKRGAG